MDLVEVFDDGERLGEHLTGVEGKRRHAHQRVDGAEFRPLVASAILLKMDRDRLVTEALEVECNAHAIGRGRAEERIKRHVGS